MANYDTKSAINVNKKSRILLDQTSFAGLECHVAQLKSNHPCMISLHNINIQPINKDLFVLFVFFTGIHTKALLDTKNS